VKRSRHGFWLEDAGPVDPRSALDGEQTADVVVVGGGYLGMWTAWQLLDEGADVILVERDVCGHGPSGRNGGFLETLWDRVGEMSDMFGADAALRVARASATAVHDVADWCEQEGVDAHVVLAPMLEVAAAPRQEGAWSAAVAACRELGAPEEVAELDAEGTRAICDSPVFGRGVLWKTSGTVHPAHLALGLRRRLLERGAQIFEHTHVVGLTDSSDGVRVRVDGGGAVSARHAVLALNSASAAVAPLRRALSVASTSVVATEPVPGLLDQLGWTGGEGIVDGRTMLHYFRTTREGRIVFGWAGGRMGMGARRREAIDFDPRIQDAAAGNLVTLLPALRGTRIEYGWGGPIDVSPVHLPWFGTLGSTHYGFGFTGNGVGPARFGGRILADLVAGRSSELTRLPIVGGLPPKRFPPEPLRILGGSAIRAAHVRVDDADAAGRRADPVTRLVASLPQRLGLHLPR
jgi:glycine/D-amino acid oxidase-like deaminating enzyme